MNRKFIHEKLAFTTRKYPQARFALTGLRTEVLAIAALLVTFSAAGAVVASPASNGVLYMYSDSGCATLLPQDSSQGPNPYIMPAVGTTVYIQIQGIPSSQFSSGSTVYIQLNYNNGVTSYTELLGPTTVDSNGDTGCVSWTVGTYSQGSGVQNACGQTATVFYGTELHPTEYKTSGNGGTGGGHYVGDQTDCTSVPEFSSGAFFGSASILAVTALLAPALLFMRRRMVH